MAERSFWTEITEELRQEIRDFRTESKAASAVPFGMEAVRHRTFRQRFDAMSNPQREAWLKKVGHDQAIAMLRSS